MINRNPIMELGSDRLFKKVFGDNNGISRLEALIAACFKANYDEVKGNVKVLNSEKRINHKEDKRQEMDIVAEIQINNGLNTIINIEVNLYPGTTLKRNFLYVMGIQANSLKNKDNYNKILPILQISFDNYEINDKNPKIIKRCFIKDDTNTIIYKDLEFMHINIAKCYKAWYDKSINKEPKEEQDLILIGALLKIKNLKDFNSCLEETSMSKEVKEDIKNIVEDFNSDEYEWAYYDKAHNDLAIRNGDISLAKEEGIKQGKLEEKIQIAKNLLKEKTPIDIISKATGLSQEELEKLSLDN
jgi:predicted transposase/invertase (TIGR01784 family)